MQTFPNCLYSGSHPSLYRDTQENRHHNNQQLLRSISHISTQKLAFLPNTTHNQQSGAFQLNSGSEQVPTNSKIRDKLPGMDMEYDRNEYFHDLRQKTSVDRIQQTVCQEYLKTQSNQDQRNNSSSRKIELPKNRIQKSITLPNVNRLSQNLSCQNTRLDWNDGFTSRSSEGTLLVDQENSREYEIIDIRPNSTSNSINRCLIPRVSSTTGTRFQRGASSSWNMAKLSNTLDKQLERTAGNSLRNNSFGKSLQRAADNQSPNQTRQLYSSIRFKKAESNRHFNTSSEGDLPHLPTFEHKNNNITRTRKDKHNSRCSQQIAQIHILQPSSILSKSNKNDLKYLINSRSIRFVINQATISLCNSKHKGLASPMVRHILQHMDQRNPIGTPSNPNLFKSNFLSQQRGDFSNSNSTMVAGSTMVYKFNESVKQIPYPWTVQLIPSLRTKHGKSKKLFTSWRDSSIPHGPEVEKG
ncbi:MAG: hypothetical protein EZS28_037067 [Streblomastix strix]|uniref:Uncharacterized protein n=1 Tax=Streblomastix strix TaxID=222440 RepID=A0A5J4U925_9EUKA|nr:MAG: hypothetical protein EZS28_037067 [Streblomastix strix]